MRDQVLHTQSLEKALRRVPTSVRYCSASKGSCSEKASALLAPSGLSVGASGNTVSAARRERVAMMRSVPSFVCRRCSVSSSEGCKVSTGEHFSYKP